MFVVAERACGTIPNSTERWVQELSDFPEVLSRTGLLFRHIMLVSKVLCAVLWAGSFSPAMGACPTSCPNPPCPSYSAGQAITGSLTAYAGQDFQCCQNPPEIEGISDPAAKAAAWAARYSILPINPGDIDQRTKVYMGWDPRCQCVVESIDITMPGDTVSMEWSGNVDLTRAGPNYLYCTFSNKQVSGCEISDPVTGGCLQTCPMNHVDAPLVLTATITVVARAGCACDAIPSPTVSTGACATGDYFGDNPTTYYRRITTGTVTTKNTRVVVGGLTGTCNGGFPNNLPLTFQTGVVASPTLPSLWSVLVPGLNVNNLGQFSATYTPTCSAVGCMISRFNVFRRVSDFTFDWWEQRWAEGEQPDVSFPVSGTLLGYTADMYFQCCRSSAPDSINSCK